jgi:hypothetical protein
MKNKKQQYREDSERLHNAMDQAIADNDYTKQEELAREISEQQDRYLETVGEPDYTTGRAEPVSAYEIMQNRAEDAITECVKKIKEAINQQDITNVEDMEEAVMHMFYAAYHEED